MNDRVRRFLNRDGDQQAGRWFSAVLAVGVLAVGYSLVTDWHVNPTWQRLKGLAALLMTALLGVLYFRRPTRRRNADTTEPSA